LEGLALVHTGIAFLKTLTGDQPALQLPILPPSTDATPPPHPFD